MPKVIVNFTPLIVLCGIGRLEILKELYKEIGIPAAVYKEVTAKEDSACRQIQNANEWLHVEQIKDHMEKKMYKAKLLGIVREVKPLLSEMKRNGFYISSSVEKLVLEQAGE